MACLSIVTTLNDLCYGISTHTTRHYTLYTAIYDRKKLTFATKTRVLLLGDVDA